MSHKLDHVNVLIKKLQWPLILLGVKAEVLTMKGPLGFDPCDVSDLISYYSFQSKEGRETETSMMMSYLEYTEWLLFS